MSESLLINGYLATRYPLPPRAFRRRFPKDKPYWCASAWAEYIGCITNSEAHERHRLLKAYEEADVIAERT